MSKLRLGQINFINCLPVNMALGSVIARSVATSRSMLAPNWIATPPTEARNDDLVIKVTEGFPAKLNQLLHHGEIDLAPISSFEYLSNPDKYSVLEGISISSKTQADSVLLFAKDIETLENAKEIYVTDKSATSVNLLKIILEERFKRKVEEINFISFEKDSNDYHVKLLIGDEALGSHPSHSAITQVNYNYVLDLGTAWYEFTKLPMVFALWCFNKNSPALAYYNEIQRMILEARDKGLNENFPDVIIEAYKQTGLPKAKLVQYFNNLDYQFTEKHEQSLELFKNFHSRFLLGKS